MVRASFSTLSAKVALFKKTKSAGLCTKVHNDRKETFLLLSIFFLSSLANKKICCYAAANYEKVSTWFASGDNRPYLVWCCDRRRMRGAILCRLGKKSSDPKLLHLNLSKLWFQGFAPTKIS